jgi:hypothetical protein
VGTRGHHISLAGPPWPPRGASVLRGAALFPRSDIKDTFFQTSKVPPLGFTARPTKTRQALWPSRFRERRKGRRDNSPSAACTFPPSPPTHTVAKQPYKELYLDPLERTHHHIPFNLLPSPQRLLPPPNQLFEYHYPLPPKSHPHDQPQAASSNRYVVML